jgi:gluconate 2-dehydrogenase
MSPDDSILKLDNVIVLPHVGTQTLDTGVNMSVIGARNLIAGLKGGAMPNCVNCHLIDKK